MLHFHASLSRITWYHLIVSSHAVMTCITTSHTIPSPASLLRPLLVLHYISYHTAPTCIISSQIISFLLRAYLFFQPFRKTNLWTQMKWKNPISLNWSTKSTYVRTFAALLSFSALLSNSHSPYLCLAHPCYLFILLFFLWILYLKASICRSMHPSSLSHPVFTSSSPYVVLFLEFPPFLPLFLLLPLCPFFSSPSALISPLLSSPPPLLLTPSSLPLLNSSGVPWIWRCHSGRCRVATAHCAWPKSRKNSAEVIWHKNSYDTE